ncbi:MAG: sugar ABC transporter substrate-binding protein, partial [Ancalomicrobiaceae bacterium]|nr:sugar ABC transporter substrate-binding protein [Ancalomicrobiaceae bacterium]
MRRFKAVAVAVGLSFFAAAGAQATGLDELDQGVVKRLYSKDMLDPAQPIGPSAWRDFVAKNPPPWKIGYASSYA